MFLGHPRNRLNPASALTHPAWWVALLMLAANDHAFKGSGMLSGAVTGKLSDFAGLFVAPALCACVLRARSRISVVACHVAVALVFALIKVSSVAAHMWQKSFTTLGLTWKTLNDPSDLVALLIVPVAYTVLAPVMQRVPEPRIRRAEVISLVMGLTFCIATAPWRLPQTEALGQADYLLADVFVHIPDHETEVGVHVRVPVVRLNCERLLRTPSNELAVGDFEGRYGGVVFWGENQGLLSVWHETGVDGCRALLIDAAQSTWFGIGSKKLQPTFVVWDTSKIPIRPIPAHQGDKSALPDGALIIREGKDGLLLTVRGPVLAIPASAVKN